jgi:hypothetical protein
MNKLDEKIGIKMITVDSFERYKKPNRRAIYTRIPIGQLDEFRKVMRQYGLCFKTRYRGPRFNVPSASRRFGTSKQTTCLLEDATHFSVYTY